MIDGIPNHGILNLATLTMAYKTNDTEQWYGAFNGIRNRSYPTMICAFDGIPAFLLVTQCVYETIACELWYTQTEDN